MQNAIIRITIDRETGQQIEQEIIGYEEIDEDAYYRPLVEVFGKRIIEALRKEGAA